MKTQTIASVGLFAKLALSQSVINSGNGYGTYYYDVVDRNGCGNNFALINTGNVECNQFTGLSLNQINSNNVVAMNRTLLASNFAKYCGKKVVVSFNGVPSSQQFFIGDGCERCATGPSTASVWNPSGAPGLDFSLSGLDGINSNGCFAGHLDISWQILDETLYNFDTNAPGQPTGPVSGGGSNPGNGGGSNPGNGSGSCSWAGHCQGATCSTDDDCSDPWGCVNGICGGSSSGGSAPPPSNTCSWVGHCIGASCGSDDDCSDNFVCNSGKCANP